MANGPSPPAIQNGSGSGFSRWISKVNSRYDGEDYAFSPPDEGSFFSLTFGPSTNGAAKSTFEKINEELGYKEAALGVTPPLPPLGYMRPRRDSLVCAKAELASGERSVTQITEQFMQEAQLARSYGSCKEDAADELSPLPFQRHDALAGYGPPEDLHTLRERLSKLSTKPAPRSACPSPQGSPKALRKTSQPSTPFELEIAYVQPQPSNTEQPMPYITSNKVSTDTPVKLPKQTASSLPLSCFYQPEQQAVASLEPRSTLTEVGHEDLHAFQPPLLPPPKPVERPNRMSLFEKMFVGYARTDEERAQARLDAVKHMNMEMSIPYPS